MATAAVAAQGPSGAPAGAEGGQDWKGMLQQMMRTVMMFMFINAASKTIFQQQGAVQEGRNPTAPRGSASMGDPATFPPANTYRGPVLMIWDEHVQMDLYVYMTEKEEFDYDNDKGRLLWAEKGLTFDWADTNTREKELNLTVTPHLQNNGSAWAHVVFTKNGAPPNHPDPHTRSYRRFRLNKYRLKKKAKNLKSLLGDDAVGKGQAGEGAVDKAVTPVVDKAQNGTGNETAAGHTIVSYWRPTLNLHLVHHFQPFGSTSQVPAPMLAEMDVEPGTGLYYPIIYHNDFWTLNDHLIALNDTVTQVPLKLTYSPIGLLKWQIQIQMDSQLKAQQNIGYSNEGESDMLRRMFLETNPILLAVTVIVSCLHMLFDMLAFKNDVAFWRKNKSMEGLSLRTIVINTFFQAVIFLYLADHETSWMVLFSSGVGLLIDIWKIHKAFLSSVVWVDEATGARLLFPRIKMEAVDSYSKNKTQQYDEEATSHLLYIVAPLMVGYAAYSLVHERHKSWYSWIVTSLTGFVYVFGFVMMTPQLYINYKLKSVAHLPWRTMVYKSLNTFIDDLFAFIIKMPTMHRLSCFRDDIIFLIYLYQRYIYPVDKKRVNEFGQITEENKDSEEAKEIIENITEGEGKEGIAALEPSEGTIAGPGEEGAGAATEAEEPVEGDAEGEGVEEDEEEEDTTLGPREGASLEEADAGSPTKE